MDKSVSFSDIFGDDSDTENTAANVTASSRTTGIQQMTDSDTSSDTAAAATTVNLISFSDSENESNVLSDSDDDRPTTADDESNRRLPPSVMAELDTPMSEERAQTADVIQQNGIEDFSFQPRAKQRTARVTDEQRKTVR